MIKHLTHSTQHMARVAMGAISVRKPIQKISAYYADYFIQVIKWKQTALMVPMIDYLILAIATSKTKMSPM
jgi:hypothetical protein